MSTLLSLKPQAPIHSIRWLIPDLLPADELVLLDGPAGVGKSLLAACLATIIGSDPPGESHCAVLYLTSPQ